MLAQPRIGERRSGPLGHYHKKKRMWRKLLVWKLPLFASRRSGRPPWHCFASF
jgi:hypothetical protein